MTRDQRNLVTVWRIKSWRSGRYLSERMFCAETPPQRTDGNRHIWHKTDFEKSHAWTFSEGRQGNVGSFGREAIVMKLRSRHRIMMKNQKTKEGASPNLKRDARQKNFCKASKRPVRGAYTKHNPAILQ